MLMESYRAGFKTTNAGKFVSQTFLTGEWRGKLVKYRLFVYENHPDSTLYTTTGERRTADNRRYGEDLEQDIFMRSVVKCGKLTDINDLVRGIATLVMSSMANAYLVYIEYNTPRINSVNVFFFFFFVGF